MTDRWRTGSPCYYSGRHWKQCGRAVKMGRVWSDQRTSQKTIERKCITADKKRYKVDSIRSLLAQRMACKVAEPVEKNVLFSAAAFSNRTCEGREQDAQLSQTALQGALQFSPKVEDWNRETIFYKHYRSIFNQCDIIGLEICRIPWKKRKIRAITAFKVIQGHRGRYQSKACMRFAISD